MSSVLVQNGYSFYMRLRISQRFSISSTIHYLFGSNDIGIKTSLFLYNPARRIENNFSLCV